MSEHENWIRYHSLRQAININKYSNNVNKILEDARKISGFVLSKPAELRKVDND